MSDIDLVVRFGGRRPTGFKYSQTLDAIEQVVEKITGFLCDALEEGDLGMERVAVLRVRLF